METYSLKKWRFIIGTNYYAIPQEEDIEKRRLKLLKAIENLDISAGSVRTGFNISVDTFERHNPWDDFEDGMQIHLGKRSGGWLFLWNFHKNKYYSNKDELLDFILKHRVVDEYGTEQNVDEFIEMALRWGQPNGCRFDENYVKEQRKKNNEIYSFDMSNYYDIFIDGLRVASSTEFS